jgi:fructose-1,6-bisphosphatase II / sedoheptulose-1,7-bisphosphatase
LVFRNDDEKARADKWGITDYNKIYTTDELAKPDNVMFSATGVTTGSMLPGVRRYANGAVTHSMVMRSKSGTTRYIKSTHNFNRKTGFSPQDA